MTLFIVVLLLAIVLSVSGLNAADFQSFGGMLSQGTWNKTGETLMYNYHCKSGSCMTTYFWFVAGIANIGATRFKFYIDGESKPSINGEFFYMHGIGFYNDGPLWGNTFNGKGALNGGVYNTYRIPFSKTITITAIPPANVTLNAFYVVVRGVDGISQVDIGPISLPPQARLKLYTNEKVTLKPLQYLDIANSPKSGALFSVFIQTSQAKNFGYLEACVRAYLDNGKTRVMLSSGTEDYFQSAYYFNGGEFKFPEAGLTYKKEPDFAAYKYHINDYFVFKDGGMRLVWRNGETVDPKTGLKCSDDHYDNPISSNDGEFLETNYTWVFEW